MQQQFKNRKIAIVFGCGGDRDKSKRSQMGKIVNKLCDKIYLTDDNPRFENAKKIRLEVKKSIENYNYKILKFEKIISDFNYFKENILLPLKLKRA